MSEVMRIMQCEATPHKIKNVEMRGIEPRAFHMQSERSTTELHPLHVGICKLVLCAEKIFM